ncbi:ABC transporter ATP-binding protein [Streptomyces sp. RY43-2]|uniref:ABC transporter ATP-binding protein n=1 Tax=Streptomyces macrolidinus TaxID=2952607 RepID=A0ABT0ZFX8_9ACTN|nr:ABC transporter ATP-binding protein [Streptomyces macrolidinus]MCN9242493.1 ABC transporter ATP-binding protein [Streptomyces macrolidinus]
MIQAIGLTSIPLKDLPPAVGDVSFEARAGRVTALLGASGAGKTTVLGLMLERRPGRGVTCFRGRPLHRVARPWQEVGVLLGDVPGHPARTVRGVLRMMSAAAGVPVRRADEVLEAVGLGALRDARLSTLTRGEDRRLGLARALLADPHALLLDDPTRGLSTREGHQVHALLRAHAARGGTVLFTTRDPEEAARTADHVVTLDNGRLAADQEAADFARTRLRPRVSVHSPHATRLGTLLTKEARAMRRSLEVVHEDGNRLSVYGSTCADIGETAFRNGILVHQLADETGDMGPRALAETAAPSCPDEAAEALPPLPPPLRVRPAHAPSRPLRYEVRRAIGTPTGYGIAAAVLVLSVLVCLLLARSRHTAQDLLPAAWPRELPLPPAALGAGLLGAHAFGDEFRHPVLTGSRDTVPRSVGLLAAKLLVAGVAALTLALLTVGCDLGTLALFHGPDLAEIPADWPSPGASWLGLVVGCAWAGVLAAGVFRSTSAGLAAVLAVPVLIVPLAQNALGERAFRGATDLSASAPRGSFGGESRLAAVARVTAQPVGGALALSITVLLCAYLLATLRSRA